MSFILMGRVVVEDKQAAVMSDMMIERAEEGHWRAVGRITHVQGHLDSL